MRRKRTTNKEGRVGEKRGGERGVEKKQMNRGREKEGEVKGNKGG